MSGAPKPIVMSLELRRIAERARRGVPEGLTVNLFLRSRVRETRSHGSAGA